MRGGIIDTQNKLNKNNLIKIHSFKNYILLISMLMFLLSIIINDNIEIKIMQFSLIIILLIFQLLLRFYKTNNHLPMIYAGTLLIWGILRTNFYPERIMTHTPLIVIVIALSIIIIFSKKIKNYFYLLNFFFLIINLYFFSKDNFIHYSMTYISIFYISYLINSNYYDSFIKILENEKNIINYQDKLKKEISNRNKDFLEISATYSKILNFSMESNISSFNSEYSFLKSTFRLFYDLINEADFGSIYIIQDNKVNYIDAIGHNIEILKLYSYDANYFELPDNKISIINNIQKKYLAHEIIPENIIAFKKATKPVSSTLIFQTAIDENKAIGIAFDIKSTSSLNFSELSKTKIEAFRNIVKLYYQNDELYNLKKSLNTDIAYSLTNLLQIHDKYTKGHSEEVASLAILVGKNLGLSHSDLEILFISSLLHDIGKTLIPVEILNKKSRLTDSEFSKIKEHPIIGYEATKDLKYLSSISNYILYHHEKYDGTGYPNGISGEEIPLFSRIITVVDSYSAMTAERPYRISMTKEEAKKEIIKCKNTHFDPLIADTFIKILNENENI